MILFVLLRAEFVQFQVGDELIKMVKPGPLLFGFSFLAGFSERIVFPDIK